MQKNAVVGIVCEYNPFHKGHAWMIERLRADGAGTIVCVMSGSYVQRAAPALLPATLRAEAAIEGGADLVLRLPLPWAVASAEDFARGSVGLLAALGCVDTLAFGAEDADTAAMQALARLLEGAELRAALKQQLATGASFATSRQAAIESVAPGKGELLASPNNILGVEYCKALDFWRERFGTVPQPLAIPRLGAQHDGVPVEGIASASWLREQVLEKGAIEAIEPYVPPASMAVYRKAAGEGTLLDPARWDIALMARLRGLPPEAYAVCRAAGEGLEQRVAQAAKEATAPAQLYDLAKTKRYAHSRVRRLCLQAALQVPRDIPAMPPFGQVLGANGRGLAFLRQAKNTAHIPVGTSLAKLARTGTQAAAIAQLEAAAEDLYSLCGQKPRHGGESYTQPAYIRE